MQNFQEQIIGFTFSNDFQHKLELSFQPIIEDGSFLLYTCELSIKNANIAANLSCEVFQESLLGFCSQLAKSYTDLEGSATLQSIGNEIDLKCIIERSGLVKIEAKVTWSTPVQHLDLQFETDQSYLSEAFTRCKMILEKTYINFSPRIEAE